MKTTENPSRAVSGLLATMIAATLPLTAEVFIFGSDNNGLDGFTQSTPIDTTETWTTHSGSVQYRNQNNGTRNSSFFREIVLDRSDGKTYRMEGVVTLTDGYADDNNRVGLYLFGDAAEVPNEDEAGAIGLIFNMDDGVARNIPDSNDADNIYLVVGIDSGVLAPPALRNQESTPFAQDLFGTTITFTVDFAFVGTEIVINATLTEEDGTETTTSATVTAADYTGDYFGFVTRARARNFGTEGDPRSNPWVMDYVSFSVTDVSVSDSFKLTIAPAAGSPGNLDFEWESRGGKVYDLVSSTDLSAGVDTWPVWEGQADLPATPPANTLAGIAGGGDVRRFFAVIEKDAPPLLVESFDAAGPDLPAGWVAVNATTVWEVGDPTGLPNLQGDDETNCVGTNVTAGNYADEVATITLTSPAIPIPAGGATLSFRQYIDSDVANGDFGTLRLLDATDAEIVEGDFPVTGIDGVLSGWTDQFLSLPPSAADQEVKLVFEFTTAADGMVYHGFYIDDVTVSPN